MVEVSPICLTLVVGGGGNFTRRCGWEGSSNWSVAGNWGEGPCILLGGYMKGKGFNTQNNTLRMTYQIRYQHSSEACKNSEKGCKNYRCHYTYLQKCNKRV